MRLWIQAAEMSFLWKVADLSLKKGLFSASWVASWMRCYEDVLTGGQEYSLGITQKELEEVAGERVWTSLPLFPQDFYDSCVKHHTFRQCLL